MSFFSITDDQIPESITRRKLLKKGLKSAAGITAFSALPLPLLAKAKAELSIQLSQKITTDPWLTLNAVFDHLLPASKSGPSAKDVQAVNYLFNLVHLQPSPQDEIDFIYKGVGWLNGYSQSQLKQNFITLSNKNKEKILRGISSSRAGENWLSTLLDYLLEAMLTPPVYGGNPNGIGWQWLEHQGGFPLPKEGTRFYEIPSPQLSKSPYQSEATAAINRSIHSTMNISVKNLPVKGTKA
jgi:hypothetical protein